jgi:hypothetical protein
MYCFVFFFGSECVKYVCDQVGLGVAKPAPLLVSQVGLKDNLKNDITGVLQDFFAELRLPYSVKRGETFLLNVTVFNYVDVSGRRKERSRAEQ